MDTKDYSRLLGYLQKILEYFIYVIFVILVIDWIVFVTYIWFRIYSFFVISPHVIYVLYIYTYFLSVFMLWLPGFYRYLLNYDEKLWFNPRKRLENDISLS